MCYTKLTSVSFLMLKKKTTKFIEMHVYWFGFIYIMVLFYIFKHEGNGVVSKLGSVKC